MPFSRLIRALLLGVVLVLAGALPAGAADDSVTIEFFWGDGCPHCATQHRFLDDLADEFPEVVVLEYEVWRDAANLELLRQTASRHGVEARAVPMTFIDDRHWVGFDGRIGAEIRAVVVAALRGDDPGDEEAPPATIWLPLVGTIDVEGASLVVATVAIGLVDGFNPCSLWALSILLALMVRGGSRRRLVAVAGTFLVITAAIYGAFIVGLYGAFAVVGHLGWVRVLVASAALTFGVVNVKDFFWPRSGPSLSIPESRKPSLYKRMREVAIDERPLMVVLAATAGLAAGVALLELPCTAGLPVLWANMVSASEVSAGVTAGLLGIYMAMYLLDELIIVAAVVVAMRVTKLQDRHGRTLKLVSGWLMIVLAVALIAAPAAMESLGGVLAVFLAAAVLSVATSAVRRTVRSGR
jgi:cytochrome c biogenesis protein CcdA/glutaredoxin